MVFGDAGRILRPDRWHLHATNAAAGRQSRASTSDHAPVILRDRHGSTAWAIAGHGRLGDTSQLFGAEIVRRLQLDRFSRLDEARLDGTDDPRHDPFLVHAHRFTLFVDAAPSADPERVAERAERILALAKPAHTAGDIAVVQPRMRVGIQAMVGLDSVVADTPLPSTTGTVRLRHGSVVTGRTAAGAGALTTSARLGSTSTLT